MRVPAQLPSPPRFAAALVALLLASCGGDGRRPGVAPRHLVLVTVEGLRADRCSAYLYPRATTDFELDGHAVEQGRALTLDDLAESGVLFHSAWAESPDPDLALAAALGGRRPLELGEGAPPELDGAAPPLAQTLADAGFLCAAFVSRPRPALPPSWGAGFERFEQAQTDLEALGPAITFVAEHDWGDQRPVFLWLHLSSPSYPFEPPAFAHNYAGGEVDYGSLFTDPAYAGPLAQGLPAQAAELDLAGLSAADRQHLGDLYDGEVAYSAYLLWHTLDLLRYFTQTEASLADAVICVAGAGGQALAATPQEPLGARGLDRGGLGVPLLLRHPGSLTGRRVLAEPVGLVDLAPTFRQWFGVPEPRGAAGSSLLGITDLRPATAYRSRVPCAFCPATGRVGASGEAWRLEVPLADLGQSGSPEPASLELLPLAGAGPPPAPLDPAGRMALLEALRAWVHAQGGRP